MQVTADISKILKNVKGNLNFIFDEISESHIGFFSFLVFLAATWNYNTNRSNLSENPFIKVC